MHIWTMSTDNQLFFDALYQSAEDKNIASLMTVDQNTAFDSLNHDILLDKLKLYGLGKDALDWIRDYLTNRAQYVKIGNAKSRWRSLKYGVPQGSVLGPLLYSVYMNDMTEAVRKTDCWDPTHSNNNNLFGQPCPNHVDDTTYQVDNKRRQLKQTKLDENLLSIHEYMNNNELSMNMGKMTITEYMVCQKKGKTPGLPPKLTVVTSPTETK